MMFLVDLPNFPDREAVVATLVRFNRGWVVLVMCSDGRSYVSYDKEAGEELDGIIMDVEYFLRGVLPQPGGHRFSTEAFQLLPDRKGESK